MAEFIVMPKLGFDMHEGVLVSWLMEVGDDVKKGDVVAEIESDKATLELEAMSSGVLLKTLADEGDVVPIGGNLAIVGEAGEDITEMVKQADLLTESESVSEGEMETAAAPSPVTSGDDSSVSESPVSDEFPGGVKATPVARRVASEHGVSLKDVNGSGPGGRIRKLDVESYLERAAQAPAITFQPTAILTGPETTEVPASRLRQAIGRRMAQSKTTIPHFYVTTEIDMAPLLSLRKEINAFLPDDQKVTVNDMIVKAAALNLRDFPNLNANFAGDKFIVHNRINIGSAVAVEGGLLTVVQKNTDFSSLAQIAIDNKTMIGRAREGKSRPEDFEGSTFTVSNLGAFDVDHFIAIINPPEAAILAVGSASQVPVVVDGELAVGWRMKATLSADHRVTDGAEAARFLQALKSIMEEPLRLLL